MTEKTVQVGERLAVSYDITNRGQSDGEQTVELWLGGEVVDSDALVVDAGSTGRMSLVTDAFTDEDDGQLYEVEIVTDDRVAQVMTVEVTAIPDSDVYLHDDWGDNKLTDRDDSGTTTHNGVEGVYRPEWTIDDQTAEANNEQLEMTGGAIQTNINLNLSETITWEWTGLELKDSGDVNEQLSFGCFMDDSATEVDRSYDGDGVYVAFDPNNGTNGLNIDTSTFSNHSIEETTSQSNIDSVKVVRKPDPEWELFINGNSAGTTTDTTNADVGFIYFADRQDGHTVDEVKVS